MKKFVTVFGLFFFAVTGLAWQNSFHVDASSTTITSAFGSGASSLVLSGLVKPTQLTICNETSVRLCVNNQDRSGSTPSSVTQRVPAGTCLTVKEAVNRNAGPRVYIMGCTGPITTGIVHGWAD